MKHTRSFAVSLAAGLVITAGLCWCTHLVTSYEFLAPRILALVVGCIFLLLAATWVMVFLDLSEALGKQPFSLKAKMRKAAAAKAAKQPPEAAAPMPAENKAAASPAAAHSVKLPEAAKPAESAEIKAAADAAPLQAAKAETAAPRQEEAAPAAKDASHAAQSKSTAAAAGPAPNEPGTGKSCAPAAAENSAAVQPKAAPPPAVVPVPANVQPPVSGLSAPVRSASFAPPPRRQNNAPTHIQWGSAEQAREMVRTRQEELARKLAAENSALAAEREKQLAQSQQVQQRRREAREADAAKWNGSGK